LASPFSSFSNNPTNDHPLLEAFLFSFDLIQNPAAIFGNSMRSTLACSSSSKLFFTNMNQTIQEVPLVNTTDLDVSQSKVRIPLLFRFQ
jgi:hypothetical protein